MFCVSCVNVDVMSEFMWCACGVVDVLKVESGQGMRAVSGGEGSHTSQLRIKILMWTNSLICLAI